MSMEQITAATAALTAAADAYGSKVDEIDAALAAFTASVNQGISDAMQFRATVDPELAASDPGTFSYQTLAEAFAAAPSGADVEIAIPAGRVVVFSETINLKWPSVRFVKSGEGLNPVVMVETFVGGNGGNNMYRIIGNGNPSVLFRNVDVQVADKADPALAWAPKVHFVGLSHGGGNIVLGFLAATITGPAGANIMGAHIGGAGICTMYNSTVDGVQLLAGLNETVYILSVSDCTLQNGATWYGGGAAPANILENLNNVTEVV